MHTIGIDLHKRESQLCLLADTGEVTERRIATTRERFSAVLGAVPPTRILVEASTESEWVAQQLESLGHAVIVADPGAYRATHRVSDAQRHVRQELAVRDALVRTRTPVTEEREQKRETHLDDDRSDDRSGRAGPKGPKGDATAPSKNGAPILRRAVSEAATRNRLLAEPAGKGRHHRDQPNGSTIIPSRESPSDDENCPDGALGCRLTATLRR